MRKRNRPAAPEPPEPFDGAQDRQVVVRLADDSPLPWFHDPATHLTVTREAQTVDRRRVGAACECRPDVLIDPVAEPPAPDETADNAAEGRADAAEES